MCMKAPAYEYISECNCKHVVLGIVSQREMNERINNSDVKTSWIIRGAAPISLPSFPSIRSEDGIKVRCWKEDRDNAERERERGGGGGKGDT